MAGEEDKKTESTKTKANDAVSQVRQQIHEVKEVTCPSGVVLKVRRLTPMDFIKAGLADIPNGFFEFVADLLDGKIDTKEADEDTKKKLELHEKFMRLTVEKGIVEPPTLLTYDKEKEDTHLLFTEFSATDQAFLSGVIAGRIDV